MLIWIWLCPLSFQPWLTSPSSSARTLHSYALAFFQAHAALSRQSLHRSIVPQHFRPPRRALVSPAQSVRTALPAIGQQRHFRIGEHFYLAYDPVSAAMLAFASTGGPH